MIMSYKIKSKSKQDVIQALTFIICLRNTSHYCTWNGRKLLAKAIKFLNFCELTIFQKVFLWCINFVKFLSALGLLGVMQLWISTIADSERTQKADPKFGWGLVAGTVHVCWWLKTECHNKLRKLIGS